MSNLASQGWRRSLARLFDRRNLLAWSVLLVSLGAVLLAWNNLRLHHPRLPVVVLSAHEPDGQQLPRVEAALAKSGSDGQHLRELLGRLLPAKENPNA